MPDHKRETKEKSMEKPYLPVVLFFTLLIGPYLLFFLLLMLLTGNTDFILLYESIMQESNAVLLKTWIIGSFVLAILGTFYITTQQTKQLLKLQRQQAREAKFNATRNKHAGFTIEKSRDMADGTGEFKPEEA